MVKDEGTRRAEIRLTVYGEPVELSMDIPIGETTVRRMLPVFREACGTIVGAAVAHAERHGRSVSCAAGCGACCRQMVPISPTEAAVLKDLVESLTPEGKARIVERFEAAKAALGEAGLLEALSSPEKPTGEAYKELGLAYFRLGIPCPFLENESCSIHPDRPLVCREYLVVSPPENCARENGQPIEVLKVQGHASKALNALTDGNGPTQWVPLSLALDLPQSSGEERPSRSGEEIARAFIEMMVADRLDGPKT